ncbi:hypothetical protein O7599_12020 [Streptomyces sp. WMMC500]|uniref:hypothetical protein n=1 Tax=Streptomyces sp. WMMC500 TaxID=3015154 RepID=UPI00248C6FCE|nr:hypothetical protein [Streptomyces sp. WMMC500]WBB63204.1 hypothetical protein O7599_12020 [Streptomyces sp. WMMC500]
MSGTQGRGGRKRSPARSGQEKAAGASAGTPVKRGAAGGGASATGKRKPAGPKAGTPGSGKAQPGKRTAGGEKRPETAKDATSGKAAESGTRGPRPPRVAVAAVLTAVEGLVIAALGGYELVLGIFGEPDSTRQAVFGGLTVLALAALPLAAAHGLWRQRRWSRGPSMITQILALPVSVAMASAGGVTLPLGLVLGVVAVVTLVCVLSPSTADALGVGPSRTA